MNVRVNKYAGACAGCGSRVAAGSGKTWKPAGAPRYLVAHVGCCAEVRAPGPDAYASSLTVLSSGAELYQNRRGRCEDAPACGCCNY